MRGMKGGDELKSGKEKRREKARSVNHIPEMGNLIYWFSVKIRFL